MLDNSVEIARYVLNELIDSLVQVGLKNVILKFKADLPSSLINLQLDKTTFEDKVLEALTEYFNELSSANREHVRPTDHKKRSSMNLLHFGRK